MSDACKRSQRLAILPPGKVQVLVEKQADQAGKLVLMVLMGITILRVIALTLTPLGLDVEEAQYWLWSQSPDAGYFTKPPMIAWVIGLTTGIFGDGLFGIKLAAPFLQLASAIMIGRIASRFSSPRAGYLASLIWITLPAAALGSFIISTDSPMIFFMLASLLVLTPLASGQAISTKETLLAGVFAGLAMMAKYAALYLPGGIMLWWLWSGRHDFRLNPRHISIFVLGMAISLAPNLVWNLMNGFVTVGHLEHNADLGSNAPSLLRSLGFLAAQAGVAGPITLGLTIIAIGATWRDKSCRFWLALAAPALAVITVQAFFSNANANWAAASWPALVVLTAHWLAHFWHGWRRVLGLASIGLNSIIAFVFVTVTISGSFGPLTPVSDPLRRLRGWDEHAAMLTPLVHATGAEAVITERRGHAAKLHWLLRDLDISIELVDHNGIAENHYEAKHPWKPRDGRRVIVVTGNPEPGHADRIMPTDQPVRSHFKISRKRKRALYFHPGIEKQD